MDNLSIELENRLNDFYNNSKQVIISEALLTFLTTYLDKEELRYYPLKIIEGELLASFIKDRQIKLSDEMSEEISKLKFYILFIDKYFNLKSLPFDFTYLKVMLEIDPIEIIY